MNAAEHTHPDPIDVAALTDLLDMLEHAPSNEQRARYLLSCNWMIERGATASANAAHALAEARWRAGQ